jgi:hypothetical protein
MNTHHVHGYRNRHGHDTEMNTDKVTDMDMDIDTGMEMNMESDRTWT